MSSLLSLLLVVVLVFVLLVLVSLVLVSLVLLVSQEWLVLVVRELLLSLAGVADDSDDSDVLSTSMTFFSEKSLSPMMWRGARLRVTPSGVSAKLEVSRRSFEPLVLLSPSFLFFSSSLLSSSFHQNVRICCPEVALKLRGEGEYSGHAVVSEGRHLPRLAVEAAKRLRCWSSMRSFLSGLMVRV